jgi:A/G-specific adenine glycosylase
MKDLSSIKQRKLFADKLLIWFEQHGRKNLPWQTSNPYHVWISEIMLQQTQVVKVIDYFQAFIQKFPDMEKLAQADMDSVLSSWSGLGYYNRAKNIHKSATICVDQYAAQLPLDLQGLMALPGIGRTTAAAILSLAKDLPYPILDGNVKRVISRVFTIKHDKISQLNKALWLKVEQLMPNKEAKNYNQALMDLGSMVCKRSKPICSQCPMQKLCGAYKQGSIDQYPQTKPQTKKINKILHTIMFMDDRKILLQQRAATGIWPQLWFLPVYENQQDINNQLKHWQNINLKQFSVKHILTHRILDIQVTCVKIKSTDMPKILATGKWYKLTQIKSIPHPTALLKILKQSA